MKHLTHIQVNQYVDNELPSHLRKEADGHLFECGQCSELIQSLQSLDTFLHNEFPIEHVSPNFASRVMSAVTQKPLISFVWKPLALFAFVLFVNALMVFQSGSPTELTAQPQSLHLVDLVKNYVSSGVHFFSHGIGKYFSFIKGGLAMNLFLVFISVGIWYVADKYLLGPAFRRKLGFFPKGN